MKKWFAYSVLIHAVLAAAIAAFAARGRMVLGHYGEAAALARTQAADSSGAVSDSMAHTDSAFAEGLEALHECAGEIVRTRNRRAYQYHKLQRDMRAVYPALLDSTHARALRAGRRAAQAASRALESAQSSRDVLRTADSLLRAQSYLRATDYCSASVTLAMQTETDRRAATESLGEQRDALEQFRQALSWLENDTLQQRTEELVERTERSKRRLAQLRRWTAEQLRGSRRLNERMQKAEGQAKPPGMLERWLIEREFARAEKAGDPPVQPGEVYGHAAEDSLTLERLLAAARQVRRSGTFADTLFGQTRLFDPIAYDADSIGEALEAAYLQAQSIDSVYREARALGRALLDEVPFDEALGREGNSGQDSAKTGANRIGVQQIDTSHFADLLQTLADMQQAPSWDTTVRDTSPLPEWEYARGPEVDTVRISLNIDEATMKKIVDSLYKITGTVFHDMDITGRVRDTVDIPYRVDPKQLEMLRRVFPPDSEVAQAGSPSTGSAKRKEGEGKAGQLVFKLFPGVKSVSKSRAVYCTRAILFASSVSRGMGNSRGVLPTNEDEDRRKLKVNLDRVLREVDTKRRSLDSAERKLTGSRAGLRGMVERRRTGFANTRPVSYFAKSDRRPRVDLTRPGPDGYGVASDRSAPEPMALHLRSEGRGAQDYKPNGFKLVLKGGTPAEWFYIPSWYICGPFPNPRRVNMHKRFPPEFGVDLDAVYAGKRGEPVRWEYCSSYDYRVIEFLQHEEYSVYYYFARLWSEKATKVWLSMGSDDRADVWLNNEPVWRSIDSLKPWIVDEFVRRVQLKQGDNAILVRSENGWIGGLFSLLIGTGE